MWQDTFSKKFSSAKGQFTKKPIDFVHWIYFGNSGVTHLKFKCKIGRAFKPSAAALLT
jgi:hypothetical protein